MGRYMRKCRGVGEVVVMEVTQVVGVRTRARTSALAAAAETATAVTEASGAKRRKVAVRTGPAAAELQISYLQLRSRSLVMKVPPPPVETSSAVAGWSAASASSEEIDGISRCSSNASVEAAGGIECRKESGDGEAVQDLEAVTNSIGTSRERRESTPSSDLRAEAGELETTAGRKRRRQPSAEITLQNAEIEEFFAAAERKQHQRFAEKYNFDVIRDTPLDGRFDWVKLKP